MTSRSGGGTSSSFSDAPMRSEGRQAAGKAAGGAVAGGVVGGLLSGNVQAGVLGSAEGMMQAAFMTASTAGMVGMLPPALKVAFDFKLTTGKPQNLAKAAEGWSDAAAKLEKAANELRQLMSNIPAHAWSTDDRAGYENTAKEYCLQLDYLHNYCMAVNITLYALAWALFAYAVFAMGMATYLGALAAAAVAPPLYFQCVALAGTAATVTHVATGALAAIAGTGSLASLVGGASFVADLQGQHGNKGAGASFDRAFANGAKSGGVNLLQNAVNTPLAFLDRTPDGGFPIKAVDLDADRNMDGEWKAGGGAKFTTSKTGGIEHEVGAWAKYKDGEWQGGEAQYKAKVPLGEQGSHGTAGGKFAWEREADGKGWKRDGSGDLGYENDRTGHKVNYEVAAKNGGYGDKLQASGPQGSLERSVLGEVPKDPEKKKEGQVDETPPWDK